MRTLLFWSLPLLILSLIFTGCGEHVSEEQKAREKAMAKIEETKKAIDGYLTLLEEKYTDLLESRKVDLDRAINKLRYELKAHTKSERVEEKAKLLEDHKQLLKRKISKMKNSCKNGCDDFSIRIDSLFNELDDHIELLDSLIVNI